MFRFCVYTLFLMGCILYARATLVEHLAADPREKVRIFELAVECSRKENVSIAAMDDEIENSHYIAGNCYHFCIFRNLGIMDRSGRYDMEKAKSLFHSHSVAGDCTLVLKTNPCEKAYDTFKCIAKGI